MIESLPGAFGKIGRLSRFCAVLLGARAEFRRTAANGPVPIEARVRLLQAWCRQSLDALGVQVEVEGSPPTQGLLLSNHLSYLDILAYSSAVPCSFVSKAEVGRWPFIGRLAEYGGTIFVQRETRSAARVWNEKVADFLQKGVPVALLPEGTTTDGSHVLRFHSSMIQPAIDAKVPIIPCAVAYQIAKTVGQALENGEKQAAWWGEMTLFPHAWKLLGNAEIRARVAFGTPLEATGSRKALSDAARERVIELRASLVHT